MSQIKVFADPVSPEASLLGLQMATFLLYLHIYIYIYFFFSCPCELLVSLCLLIRTPVLLVSYLITLLKTVSPTAVTFLVWGVRASYEFCGEHNSAHHIFFSLLLIYQNLYYLSHGLLDCWLHKS